MLRTLDPTTSHDVDVLALRSSAAHLGRAPGDGVAQARDAPPQGVGPRRMHRLAGFWAPDNGQVVPLRTAFVSEHHATVAWHDGALYVCDLSSRHGTFVNGKRVSPLVPHMLKDGDLLEFAVPSSAAAPGQPPPPGAPRFAVRYPDDAGHGAAATKAHAARRVTKPPHAEAEAALMESITCPLCAEPLADAAGGDCAHAFCHTCVMNTILKSPQGAKCPVCRDPSLGNVRRVLALDETVDRVMERFGTLEQIRRLRLRRHFNALFRQDLASRDATSGPRVELYESRQTDSLHITLSFPRGDVALVNVGLPSLRRFLRG